jgi:DNA invertase Pin-like site-specific DNA recombinase
MSWNVVRVYKDKGISGAKSSRPALSRMLRDAKHGLFAAVLIARIDRLARSLSHLLWVVQELDRLGIALKDLNTGFDLETSTGRLTLGILGSIAQFERDLIIERTKAGIARARAEGKHCGRPAKKLDVAEIRRMRSDGKPVAEIAKVFRVSRQTIYSLLKTGR